MKKEILCQKCAGQIVEATTTYSHDGIIDTPFCVSKVFGSARMHYICDRCFQQINKGTQCIALSIHSGSDYYKWEPDFIDVIRQSSEWAPKPKRMLRV